MAVVEEKVLEGRNAGPRLIAWTVHHAAQVICACRQTHATQARRWRVSVNACGSETLFWKGRTSSIRDARRRGCSDSASSHPATSWLTLTGGSARSGRSREPTLTTGGKSCHLEILSRPQIWSQRQLNSHAREELKEKSTPLHNVWRDIRSMLCHQIQIVIRFRRGCTSSRVTSWRTGRQNAAQVAGH